MSKSKVKPRKKAPASRFIVLNESFPERCEICHQTDLFDPQTGECRRCSGLPLPELLQNTDTDFEPDQPEILTPQALQEAVAEQPAPFNWKGIGYGKLTEAEPIYENTAQEKRQARLAEVLMGVMLILIVAISLNLAILFSDESPAVLIFPLFLFVFIVLPLWFAKRVFAGKSKKSE